MRALHFLSGPCFSYQGLAFPYEGLGIKFQYLFLAWLGLGGEHEHHQHHSYEGLAFPMKALHFLFCSQEKLHNLLQSCMLNISLNPKPFQTTTKPETQRDTTKPSPGTLSAKRCLRCRASAVGLDMKFSRVYASVYASGFSV